MFKGTSGKDSLKEGCFLVTAQIGVAIALAAIVVITLLKYLKAI